MGHAWLQYCNKGTICNFCIIVESNKKYRDLKACEITNYIYFDEKFNTKCIKSAAVTNKKLNIRNIVFSSSLKKKKHIIK